MIARAPGKIVISGAYAVLEGAPAIVTAVNRYVTADTSKPATFITPEVREAIGDAPAPHFDATSLRDHDRKLGLGSSAAILVASLAAIELAARGSASDDELCAAVLSRALAAHARAQGGGSGIDVATSAYGKTLILRRKSELLEASPSALPSNLYVEVWATLQAASTPLLIAKVSQLKAREPAQHRAIMDAQHAASEAAAVALEQGDAAGLIRALSLQHRALSQLGETAGTNIVTDEVRELHERATRESAAVIPSGAGGGDIALYVGLKPPSPALSARAGELGHRGLPIALEARGVHAVSALD